MNKTTKLFPALAMVAVSMVAGSFSAPASGQLASQSRLTPADVDASFELTLDDLAQDSRAFYLSPREIAWSPDSAWVYFRWREDPESGQVPEEDPWYAVDAAARELRRVDDSEQPLIPNESLDWSSDRQLAAWSRQASLVIWTPDGGTRVVYSGANELGEVSVAQDGRRVFFASTGFQPRSADHGDLWSYELASSRVRPLARVVPEKEGRSEQLEWMETQQLDLVEIVRKRHEFDEREQAKERQRDPLRPQDIPVEEGHRIFQLRLSPDGRFVTFLSEKQAEPEATSFMEFVNESGYATEKSARPKVGEVLPSYRFGMVAVNPKSGLDDIEIQWLDDGIDKETIIHGPYWSPDGNTGALQILSMDHKERWIALIDLGGAGIVPIDHQTEEAWIGGPLVEGRWRPGFLRWLPQGDAFAFASVETGWSMLYLAEQSQVDSREWGVRQLTDGTWEVRAATLSPDGESWLVTTSADHPGEEQLYHLPARGGEMSRVTQREGKARALVSPDGKRLAVSFESTRQPADLYLQDNRAEATPTRITKSGTDDFFRYGWIDSEIINYPDSNGLTTWAEVWERPSSPHGAAVVYAHGCGECAQAVDKGFSRFGSVLYANYLHQNGYVSASIDYRGSSGYGHANRTYAYRQMGISDIDSGLPLLDILSERYGVDRDRIGVYGGSYGGFYTLMSLFRHPGDYRAGVALYPVTDWAHYNQGYTSRILNGTPMSDPEAYRRSSPMYYADGLRDALQIQHGLVDNNVQIQDSFRLAQVLMEKKKDFDLVVYPVEDHGWDEIPSRRDSYKRMTEWFDRFLLTSKNEVTTQGSR